MIHSILFPVLSSQASREKNLPFICAAKDRGIKTTVICHEDDDELLVGDTNHVISLAEFHDLNKVVKSSDFDLLLTQNSRLAPFVAPLAESLKVPTYSPLAANTLTYKDHFARYSMKNLPHTPGYYMPTFEDDFHQGRIADRRVVLKPTYSTGALNTFIFQNERTLLDRLRSGDLVDEENQSVLDLDYVLKTNQSKSLSKFMVQEFVPYVRQLGMELFVFKGRVHKIFAADILTTSSAIEAFAHMGPVDVDPHILSLFQKMADDLGLYNCHMSPDIVFDDQERAYVLDVNLNIGGEGLYECVQQQGCDLAGFTLDTMASGVFTNEILTSKKMMSYCWPSFKDGTEIQWFIEGDNLYSQALQKAENMRPLRV